jgi:hypothetical protein
MPTQITLPSQPGRHSGEDDSAFPRVRRRRVGNLARHPLIVYSAFVTVSLLLLGSMAVASLPH